MRFNEFNIVQEDMKLPPEKTNSKSWVARSALDLKQDPADISQQQQPAYQRKGVKEPITIPKPGTKPTVNLADPKQAAAYKAQLDLEKKGVPLSQTPKDTLGAVRPGSQTKPNYSLATDPIGKASAGEPRMGATSPAVWKDNRNPTAPASTSPAPSINTSSAPASTSPAPSISSGAKEIGKKVLGRVVPFAGVAGDSVDAYRRYKSGDYVGAGIAATGAAGGMIPGIGVPISYGAAGVNLARDAYNNRTANPTNLNPVISAANAAAAKKGNVGRGGLGQTPATAPKPDTALPPVAAPKPDSAVKPPVSTGTSAPAQSTSMSYKGSAGAQAIQQANANKISDVNKIRAGDTIKVGGQDYTIKPGDTLDSIAKNQQPTTANVNPSTPTTSPNDNQETNIIPTTDMAENTKSLNRIKSLAGLK